MFVQTAVEAAAARTRCGHLFVTFDGSLPVRTNVPTCRQKRLQIQGVTGMSSISLHICALVVYSPGSRQSGLQKKGLGLGRKREPGCC